MNEQQYKCRLCGTVWDESKTIPHHAYAGTRTCGDSFCGATCDPMTTPLALTPQCNCLYERQIDGRCTKCGNAVTLKRKPESGYFSTPNEDAEEGWYGPHDTPQDAINELMANWAGDTLSSCVTAKGVIITPESYPEFYEDGICMVEYQYEIEGEYTVHQLEYEDRLATVKGPTDEEIREAGFIHTENSRAGNECIGRLRALFAAKKAAEFAQLVKERDGAVLEINERNGVINELRRKISSQEVSIEKRAAELAEAIDDKKREHSQRCSLQSRLAEKSLTCSALSGRIAAIIDKHVAGSTLGRDQLDMIDQHIETVTYERDEARTEASRQKLFADAFEAMERTAKKEAIDLREQLEEEKRYADIQIEISNKIWREIEKRRLWLINPPETGSQDPKEWIMQLFRLCPPGPSPAAVEERPWTPHPETEKEIADNISNTELSISAPTIQDSLTVEPAGVETPRTKLIMDNVRVAISADNSEQSISHREEVEREVEDLERETIALKGLISEATLGLSWACKLAKPALDADPKAKEQISGCLDKLNAKMKEVK